MARRKPTHKYYFSVEGETEQWYLKWLQDMITMDCPVKENPLKQAKSLTVTRKIEIYHYSGGCPFLYPFQEKGDSYGTE